MGPSLHGVRVGRWLVSRSRCVVLFIGVVGTWSGCSHRAAECLAYVVWMVFGDVSVSVSAQTDCVEFSFIRRHLASKRLGELGHLMWLRAECSEEL